MRPTTKSGWLAASSQFASAAICAKASARRLRSNWTTRCRSGLLANHCPCSRRNCAAARVWDAAACKCSAREARSCWPKRWRHASEGLAPPLTRPSHGCLGPLATRRGSHRSRPNQSGKHHENKANSSRTHMHSSPSHSRHNKLSVPVHQNPHSHAAHSRTQPAAARMMSLVVAACCPWRSPDLRACRHAAGGSKLSGHSVSAAASARAMPTLDSIQACRRRRRRSHSVLDFAW